jgi:hypothetical protein
MHSLLSLRLASLQAPYSIALKLKVGVFTVGGALLTHAPPRMHIAMPAHAAAQPGPDESA